MRESTIPALVVGAGPVGLTMAAEFRRHGVAVRVVDRSPTPTDKSKALVVWSRTLEILDDMGIGEEFVAVGRRAVGASIYHEGRRLVHVGFTSIPSPHPYGLLLPQSETERLLDLHLRRLGGAVERSVELVDLGADEHGITAVLHHADDSREIVRTSWLLACDGAHSSVRHTLGIPFVGEAEPNDWMLADVHLRGPVPEDEMSLFLHEKGPLGVFPMGHGRFRIIADTGPAEHEGPAPAPSLAEVAEVLAERGPGDWHPYEPVWLSSFRIHERKVAAYRHGRVFLAGDAAHVHSPAGGQGMNTGMQDAYNLAWKIALVERGLARAEPLLASYDAERSPVGEQVLARASAMTKLATLRHPLAQQIRNRLVPLIASLDAVQHRLEDQFTELAIAYPRSPIQGEHRGLSAGSWLLGGGVAPGERAPDAALRVGETGRPTTLFEVLRGTSHVLLLLEGSGEAPSSSLLAIGARVRERYGHVVSAYLVVSPGRSEARPDWPGAILGDPTGELHERYAATGPTLYLIRPDGYVGYRSQPADEDRLLEHLERYLMPRDPAHRWNAKYTGDPMTIPR